MKKILLIEDDLLIRDCILELLETENFEVIAAGNGLDGISLAHQHQPDLILCDVMMPGVDGYVVLEALRTEPLTARIPFIFLTALADRINTRKGMELGADDYLPKPCTPDELLRAIAIRLEKHWAITQHYNNTLNQVSQELDYLVHHDSLTNLPNRLSLQEHFNQIVLTNTVNNQESIISIFCIGIDKFSRINESLGHANGDLLLKIIADKLGTYVNSNNIVYYLNSDKFVLVSVTNNQKTDIAKIAQNIINTLSEPVILESEQEVFITTSVGIAIYPFDSRKIDKLLDNANKAVTLAKHKGGNNYEFYTKALDINISERIALEKELRHALERQEFQLSYQPQVSLQTGKVVGAEVLLRWYHPEQGIVSPAKFIPLLEETGLIIPVGEWILKTACQQIKALQIMGFENLRVAVNLSAYQFNQDNFAEKLCKIIAETKLDAKYLDLELTESILVQNTELTIKQLNTLKELGVQIAIDDFGTGYSSLSYLQHLPFDILKIDQSFVRTLSSDNKNTAITIAIIQMAHQLNLKIIAEGVEKEAELNFLRQYQCHEMQGYWFSRPLAKTAFEELLFSGKRLQLSTASGMIS